jgi:hypothetical protein
MVFSPDELEQFRRDGYVVARAVAPAERLHAAIEVICAFHRVRLDQPSTWHRIPADSWDIVPIHQAQELWDIRSLPVIHQAFSELLGTPRLWVSMDRAGYKPPVRGHRELERSTPFHWDTDVRAAASSSEARVQGMLYLTDTSADQGAFECVPSLYRELPQWLAAHPGADKPDVEGREVVRVPGRAGDLVIWSARLPHRGGRNDGATPRLTQYLSMKPARGARAAEERVALWRERRVPENWRSWPSTVVDPQPPPNARQNAQGRNQLRLDPWD